jgi:hypothetical protein
MFVSPGRVLEFEECPAHFTVITDDTPADFINDSEEALMAKKWKFSDAAKAIKEAFSIELKKGSKADIVASIVDARYRVVD